MIIFTNITMKGNYGGNAQSSTAFNQVSVSSKETFLFKRHAVSDRLLPKDTMRVRSHTVISILDM